MDTYVINIQDSNGDYEYKEVEANSSDEAVKKVFGNNWRKLSNNEIPNGIYETGTYSLENGYLTVKKPSRVHDWFRRDDIEKINFVMRLYENNPSFVTEVISDKTTEDFSEYTIEETLYEIDKGTLELIYIQLKNVNDIN